MKKIKPQKFKSGIVMISVLLIISLIALMIGTALLISELQTRITKNRLVTLKNQLASEAGIKFAEKLIISGKITTQTTNQGSFYGRKFEFTATPLFIDPCVIYKNNPAKYWQIDSFIITKTADHIFHTRSIIVNPTVIMKHCDGVIKNIKYFNQSWVKM